MGYVLTFGKHEGEDISNTQAVPTSYLQWIRDTFDTDNPDNEELLLEVDEELENRSSEDIPWWDR